MNFRSHTAFTGNAGNLATLAIDCGRAFGLPVDPAKTSERLVRYYVSVGVLDRPDRVGRDAAYGYRHLLQLLTARRMAQAGTPLSVIAEHNRSAPTKVLEDELAEHPPATAERPVSRFKGGHALAVNEPQATMRYRSTPAPMALPDVLDEVRQLKDEWMNEIAFLKDVRSDLDAWRNQRADIDRRLDQIATRQDALLDALSELRRLIRDGSDRADPL